MKNFICGASKDVLKHNIHSEAQEMKNGKMKGKRKQKVNLQ